MASGSRRAGLPPDTDCEVNDASVASIKGYLYKNHNVVDVVDSSGQDINKNLQKKIYIFKTIFLNVNTFTVKISIGLLK